MKPLVLFVLAGLLSPIVAGAQSAPIVADQVRVAGSRAINPPGAIDVMQTAAGATDPYELMESTGFAAIQDFSALGGDARAGATFRFTEGGAPDVRLRFVSNPANVTGSANLSSPKYSTSANSAFRILGGPGRVVSLRIEFGRHDVARNEFVPAPRGSGVIAAGFTLSGAGLKKIDEKGVAVRYLDASGNLISGQTMQGRDAPSYYSGRRIASGQDPVAVIEIQFQLASDGAGSIGLDDLGFTDFSTAR